MPRPLGEYDPTAPVTDLEKASWYTDAEKASWYPEPKTAALDQSLLAEVDNNDDNVKDVLDPELTDIFKAAFETLKAKHDAEALKEPANPAQTHVAGAMDARSAATLQAILATSILATLDRQANDPMPVPDGDISNDAAFNEDFGEWAKLMETQGDAMDVASAALVKEVLAAADGDNLDDPAFNEDLKAWAKLLVSSGDDAVDPESAALIKSILAKPSMPATGEPAKPAEAMNNASPAELASILQAQEDEKLAGELATRLKR